MNEPEPMPSPNVPAELEEFKAYLRDLAEKARDKERWGAALSKNARGKLSGHWSTIPKVLGEAQAILKVLGIPDRFVIDVAADPGSAVAPEWFGPFHMDGKRRDALAPGCGPWTRRDYASWLNAPYSEISAFTEKCAELDDGHLLNLAFARTDTKWFHDYVVPHARAVWIRKGRIPFIDPLTGKPGASAPAPSMLTLWGQNLDDGRGGDESEAEILERANRVGPWQRIILPRGGRA